MNKQIEKQEEMFPVPTISETQLLMDAIIRAASDPNTDVEKMRSLWVFWKEIQAEQAKREAELSFAEVCSKMPRVRKNGTIDFGKGDPIPYGKWDDVDAAIRPIYQGGGFTLTFDTQAQANGWTKYTAIALHKNGHRITSSIDLPLDSSGGKQNIQGAGSSSSYGQRYSTKNLFNLIFEGEDDDGKSASTITVEQAAEIDKKLNDLKADKVAFLKYFGVESVLNIPSRDYKKVIAAIAKKEKAINKEKTK